MDYPTWLALPAAELAAMVAPHRLALLLALDGTRRWTHLQDAATLTDWQRHTVILEAGHLALIERVLACGVHTLAVPLFARENFARGEDWLRPALSAAGLGRVANAAHAAAYRRWGARVRLGGTWSLAAPWAAARLAEIQAQLVALTPHGDRLVLWQCDAVDPMAAMLSTAARRGPDPAAIREVFYPEGPEKIHLAIKGGRLNTLNHLVLPLLVDHTDLYVINNLVLDLSDLQLRAVLYDYFFLRHLAPNDYMQYDEAFLTSYQAWYNAQAPGVLGLGALAPGAIWHAHGTTPPAQWPGAGPRE